MVQSTLEGLTQHNQLRYFEPLNTLVRKEEPELSEYLQLTFDEFTLSEGIHTLTESLQESPRIATKELWLVKVGYDLHHPGWHW